MLFEIQYTPASWLNLQLPSQLGAIRFTGPIPLNIANQVRVAAPQAISIPSTCSSNFVYPVAVVCRRMDFEILRLRLAFQKEKAVLSTAPDPSHFALQLRTPLGEIHSVNVIDISKPVIKKTAFKGLELDTGYAYQGGAISDWEIERVRISAQATLREYLFDLHPYFPNLSFGAGLYSIKISNWALDSDWISTAISSVEHR